MFSLLRPKRLIDIGFLLKLFMPSHRLLHAFSVCPVYKPVYVQYIEILTISDSSHSLDLVILEACDVKSLIIASKLLVRLSRFFVPVVAILQSCTVAKKRWS